ncbi:MAG: DUF1360 domain-containing protein [Pyrinomonadaceae bacterium]
MSDTTPQKRSSRVKPSPQPNAVAQIYEGYKGGDKMPLAGYASLVGIYSAAYGSLLLAATQSGRELPERIGYGDLVLLSIATHKLSRIITKDRVTSPLRAPFTEFEKPAGTSEVSEKSRGTGMQRAVGDLLICPWCMSPWVAGALVFGLVFKPRATRIIGGILAAATVSDLLHYADDAIKKATE